MRMCVFGDIHGNLPALQAALPKILAEKCTTNVFLGDACGYYSEAQAVIETLMQIPDLVAVRGNHDDLFIGALNGDKMIRKEYAAKYGPALETFLEQGDPAVVAWLKALPVTQTLLHEKVFCCHGSPRDPLNEYVYPDTPMQDHAVLPHDWFFLGHTHYAMDRKVNAMRFVNPGALGQPRDGFWPRYAVVDTDRKSVRFCEVRFDRESFVKKIRDWAPEHPYLADVWERIGHL